MRDEQSNQENQKLPSERIAERNSASNRFKTLQGAQVDGQEGNANEEITAGYEAMRNYPLAGQSAQQAQQMNNRGRQGQDQNDNQQYPADNLGGGQKENALPGTVSLDTDPIDRPTKLDNEPLR